MDYSGKDSFSIYEESLPFFSCDLLGTKDDSVPVPSGATNGLYLTGKPVTRHPDQLVTLSSLAFLEQLNLVRKCSFGMPAQSHGFASFGAP